MFSVRCWMLNVAVLATAGSALAEVHYVDVNSTNATPPYTNWTTASTNIQDAVDSAVAGDEIVVTNGLYATGGRAVYGTMTNRVAVDKPLTLRSVNGPQFTIIQGHQVPPYAFGDGAIRCVYLTNGASLSGFTLTNGATHAVNDYPTNRESSGGGLWCESATAVISNCVVAGNSAYLYGGGAYQGTLNNCTLTSNSADEGGGAYYCTLNNCTLTDNYGYAGGGTVSCALYNCSLSGNFAYYAGGGADGCVLNNCTLTGNLMALDGWTGSAAYSCYLYNCTLTGNGGGYAVDYCNLWNCIIYYNGENYRPGYSGLYSCCTTPGRIAFLNDIIITNAPLFVDLGSGNLRLQSNSPCINIGWNNYVVGSTDLDGRPRLVGGTVDIGAYEFQPGVSGQFLGWLQQYELPTSGAADFTDPDGDGLNNWQEWIAGTIPTDASSVLKMFSPSNNVSGLNVSWQSVSGKNYFLQRSADLFAQPAFLSIASNLVGQAGTTVYPDTTATNSGPYFYRVGVQ